MIRKSYLFGAALFMLMPDNGGASGSEVTSTDNAHAPVTDPPESDAGLKAAAAAAGPTPPPANSALAIQADPKKNTATHNPFKQDGAPKTKMIRLTVLKLAIYEPDGKHVAGHEIETTTDRANELISTGYAAVCEGAEVHEEDAEGVLKARATNTPPVV